MYEYIYITPPLVLLPANVTTAVTSPPQRGGGRSTWRCSLAIQNQPSPFHHPLCPADTHARVPMGTGRSFPLLGYAGRCGRRRRRRRQGRARAARTPRSSRVAVPLYRGIRQSGGGGGGGVFPGGGIQNPREVESILPYRRRKMGGGGGSAVPPVYLPLRGTTSLRALPACVRRSLPKRYIHA